MINTIKILVVMVGLIVIGCKKEPVTPGVPLMAFVADTGYISTDTLLASGDTALIAINCTWNGTDFIKTINTYMNNNLVGESFSIHDSLGQSLTFVLKITKSLSAKETWLFEAIDANENIGKISLVITTDNSGGNIVKINSIIGAQLNPSIGSYYNILTNTNYLSTEADTSQAVIDILGGYNFNEKSFLTSPGSANLFEAYDFTSWTTKNLTLYCQTNLSAEQFGLINKDNLLISSFASDKAEDYIKGIKPNQVYSFKTQDDRYGLLLIISEALSESGFITFDIKIQE